MNTSFSDSGLVSVSFTAPPSPPVSLSWEYESDDGGVSIMWRPPLDMGGRSEVWYGVVCRICPSPVFTNPASCSWCGEGVTFSPSQNNLKQPKVTLHHLLARVTYLIQVGLVTGVWSWSCGSVDLSCLLSYSPTVLCSVLVVLLRPQVQAMNEVSALSPFSPRFSSINFTISQSGER